MMTVYEGVFLLLRDYAITLLHYYVITMIFIIDLVYVHYVLDGVTV